MLHAGKIDLETKFLKTDCGASLSYVMAGYASKPSLVLLPGWCGSIAFWAEQIDFFSKDYHVIAIDYPGFGLSNVSAGARLSMADQSMLVIKVLEHEQITSCTIVGHSIGGALGLCIAGAAQGLVTAVIGADSYVYMDFYRQVPEAGIEAIVSEMQANFKKTVRNITAGYFLESSDIAQKDWIVDEMASANKKIAIQIIKQFLNWDFDTALLAYDGPVGVVASASAYNEQAFTSLYGTRVKVRTIEDTGHFIMLDAPDAFNQEVSNLLTYYIS